MKKLLTSLVALSILVSPTYAVADNGHRHYSNRYPEYSYRHHRSHQYESYRDHRRYRDRSRISTGEAILIIGAAAVIGSAIAGSNNRSQNRVVRYRDQVCQETYRTDSYGNLRQIERKCW